MSLYRKVCARGGWISLAASAMLLSLGMVLTLAAAVFGVGFWWEADQLVSRDHASISDCLIQSDGRAISLIWVCPARGPAWQNQLGVHELAGGPALVKSLWPGFHPECMTASPSTGRLFLASADGEIYSASPSLTDARLTLLAIQPEGAVFSLACSPDGRHLLSTGFSTLCGWDAQCGTLSWQRDDFDVNCLAFDHQSRVAICGLRDGRVVELDLTSGCTLRELARLPFAVRSVSVSPSRVACVTGDGRVLLANWPTGDVIWQDQDAPMRAGGYRARRFSPCGELLICPAKDDIHSLAVRDVQTGALLGTLRGHTKAVVGARFTVGGRLISWGADGTVRTWDARRSTALGTVSLALPVQKT